METLLTSYGNVHNWLLLNYFLCVHIICTHSNECLHVNFFVNYTLTNTTCICTHTHRSNHEYINMCARAHTHTHTCMHACTQCSWYFYKMIVCYLSWINMLVSIYSDKNTCKLFIFSKIRKCRIKVLAFVANAVALLPRYSRNSSLMVHPTVWNLYWCPCINCHCHEEIVKRTFSMKNIWYLMTALIFVFVL